MIVDDIVNIIESAAPLRWQEEWDNSGLQVGNRNAEVQSVLLTTDVTEAVVAEAIKVGCQMIISHHPLLFHGLKQVCGQNPQARCVETAIRHDIAIYSAHTSMDSWLHGVSGRMAEKIGIKEYQLLNVAGGAVCESEGKESFGLGVIGELPEAMTTEAFVQMVKAAFDAPVLRYVDGGKKDIKKVALCGGAGAEFVEEAIRQGADAFITADVRYHTFLDVVGRICLIDMDHWVSEHFTREIFCELLEGKVKTVIAKADQSPVKVC